MGWVHNQQSALQVMTALGMVKAGPKLGQAIEAVMDWQLAHPRGSACECLAWLRQNHAVAA
jgi:hypothetical protein